MQQQVPQQVPQQVQQLELQQQVHQILQQVLQKMLAQCVPIRQQQTSCFQCACWDGLICASDAGLVILSSKLRGERTTMLLLIESGMDVDGVNCILWIQPVTPCRLGLYLNEFGGLQ